MTYIKTTNTGFYLIEITDSRTIEELNSEGIFLLEKPTLDSGYSYGNVVEYEPNKYIYSTVKVSTPFDIYIFKDDVKIALNLRMGELYDCWGVISDNLKVPMQDEHYQTIKFFMDFWLTSTKITQTDYDNFVICFTNQNIDISIY